MRLLNNYHSNLTLTITLEMKLGSAPRWKHSLFNSQKLEFTHRHLNKGFSYLLTYLLIAF